MLSTATIETWKIFIKGRLAEESGDLRAAIEAYDLALKDEPNNINFLRAKSNALIQLSQPEETAIDTISRAYQELATKLVAENDTHEAWMAGLTDLLNKTEKASAQITPATQRGPAMLAAHKALFAW